MEVVKNKVVFFISILLDCVATHTACLVVNVAEWNLMEGQGKRMHIYRFPPCH